MATKPAGMKGPCYLVHKGHSGSGEWGWTLFGPSGEVIAVSSQSFPTKWDAREAAGRVHDFGRASIVVPED